VVSSFVDDTFGLLQDAARELKSQSVDGFVLDMRNNPGGLLDQAVEVASIWLPKGSTVLLEKEDGVVTETYRTSNNPILEKLPVVVLQNEGSASASEIVAGALRDEIQADIVGQTSFGKGSVQRLIPLSAGGTLKVTVARWFTPSGATIDKDGIVPDHEVERTAEDREAERDPQLDKAKELLQN